MAGLDTWHHSQHLGVWYWRPTVWWKPQGGVSPEEREWLHGKYPRWEEQYGPIWDVIIGNINDDRMELTLPETLPWLCNLCHLPIGTAGSPRARSTRCAATRSHTTATPTTSARGPAGRSGRRTGIPCTTRR